MIMTLAATKSSRRLGAYCTRSTHATVRSTHLCQSRIFSHVQGRTLFAHSVASLQTRTSASLPALCVDLDGTLVKSDTLVDSALALARHHPAPCSSSPAGSSRQSRLQTPPRHCRPARRHPSPLQPGTPPISEQQHAAGRPIYLATAADTVTRRTHRRPPRPLHRRPCLRRQLNLAGNNKLAAFRPASATDFSYIGNALPDLPLLQNCQPAHGRQPHPRPPRRPPLRQRHPRPHLQRTGLPPQSLAQSHPPPSVGQERPHLPSPAARSRPAPGLVAAAARRLSQLRPLRLRNLHRQRPPRPRSRPPAPPQAPPPLRLGRPLRHRRRRRRRPLPRRLCSPSPSPSPASSMPSRPPWPSPPSQTASSAGSASTWSPPSPTRSASSASSWSTSSSSPASTPSASSPAPQPPASPSPPGSPASASSSSSPSPSSNASPNSKACASAAEPPPAAAATTSPTSNNSAASAPPAAYASVVVLTLYISNLDAAQLYHHTNRLWLLVPVLLLWISRLWLQASRGQLDEDPVVYAITDKRSLLLGLLVVAIVISAL